MKLKDLLKAVEHKADEEVEALRRENAALNRILLAVEEALHGEPFLGERTSRNTRPFLNVAKRITNLKQERDRLRQELYG
jgi:hypothetical protein